MSEKRLLVGMIPNFDDGVQHLPPRYVHAADCVGADSLMIPFETSTEELETITDKLDGVLFTGGVDVDPSMYGAVREPECGMSIAARDDLEKRLLPICLKKKIPVLGICRGIQILNVLFGGTLVQDIPTRYGTLHQMPKGTTKDFWHEIKVVPGTMLHEILGGDIPVDSYHHQCIKTLGDGLIPTAYAIPEGFIEAFELPRERSFLMAVQWHPEVTFDIDVKSRVIFERFRDEMLAYRG